MKKLLCIIIIHVFAANISFAQVKLVSWNIQDFGKSKNSAEIAFIAETLRDFDVVALQEVVAGPGGAQAVAKLADELNRKGAKWDYSISNPTISSPYSSERYAFLWKTSKVKIVGKAWLDQNFVPEIEREPFMADFKYKGKIFTIVSFHAIPKSKNPEQEIKYFKSFPSLYTGKNLIFLGDFNTPQSNSVFNPLKKMGYIPAFENQKTSLRTKCIEGDCLASEYDNIFFNLEKINCLQSEILHFYLSFSEIKEARKISDHVPVWMKFFPN